MIKYLLEDQRSLLWFTQTSIVAFRAEESSEFTNHIANGWMSHKLQTNGIGRILSLSVRMLIQNLDTFIWSDIKFSFYPYFIYSAPDKSLRNFKVISLVENLIQLKFDTYPPEIYFEHGKCLSKGSLRKLCMFLFDGRRNTMWDALQMIFQ